MTISMNVCIPSTIASSYPIWIGSNLLENISLWMPKHGGTVVIITDTEVQKHYATSLENVLNQAGYKTHLYAFSAGESSKNIHTKSQLEEKMLLQGCDRDTLVLSVGGGVVGDLAGFIAATYMRGIPYIQIPTTLLAMLDSSVGGKTGIDTPQGKNLIGAFWQPKAVISDITCLQTLPKKHLINGLIEAIKIGLTSDAEGLRDLEQNLNAMLNLEEAVLIRLIQRAVQLKANIVQQDEREQHQRVILNFGHTIGHALEQLTDYQLLHGYAVALGILVESKIAQCMGMLDEHHYQYIKALLLRLHISTDELKKFDVNEVIKRTQLDKKNQSGRVRYVLLNGLGSVFEENNHFAHPVPDEIVKKAFLATIMETE